MIKAIVLSISVLLVFSAEAKPRDAATTTKHFKGYPITCIHDSMRMSCDWIKYHKEREIRLKAKLLCEDISLRMREFYTKEGDKVFFPKVEGECE